MTMCKSLDMELATFETHKEMTEVGQMVLRHKDLFEIWTHIGGMSDALRDPNSWRWINTKERITYSLPWFPGEPNGAGNEEYCLSIDLRRHLFEFNDLKCHNAYIHTFLCHKIESLE
jgi:hypothetical protein